MNYGLDMHAEWWWNGENWMHNSQANVCLRQAANYKSTDATIILLQNTQIYYLRASLSIKGQV